MISMNGQSLQGLGNIREVQFIKKECERIKREKNIVIFQDNRLNAKKRKPVVSAQGRKMGESKPPARMIPNIDKMVKEGMNPVSVAYTDKIVTIQRDGVVNIKRSNLIFEDFWSLNPQKDFELIFYLRHVSSVVKNREIVEFNEEEETDKKLTMFDGDTELKFHIRSTLNPEKGMNGNDTPLRTIAAAWGVMNAEEGSINKISLDLYNLVMESEKKKNVTKRGIKEFVAEVHAIQGGDYELIKLRADIQKAINNKIVIFDENRCVFMQDSPIEKEFFRIKPSAETF